MADKRIPNAAIRRAWGDNRPLGVCSAEIGLTRVQLWKRAKALNLPERKCGRKFRIADENAFRTMYTANVSVLQIAMHFGISEPTVCYRARSLNLPKRNKHIAPISIEQFREMQLGARMRAAAALEQGARAA